jgi:predicted GNAT family N-acyltransferase
MLGPQHDSQRALFSCGVESLDRYLKQQAGQDNRKRVTVPYVLLAPDGLIAGYYTLSADGIRADDLPAELVKQLKLPSYDRLPATLIGRLARNVAFKGQGVGRELLADALKLALQVTEQIASMAVIVEAKDEKAARFYSSFGFIRFPDTPNRLYIPMQTVRKALPSSSSAAGS